MNKLPLKGVLFLSALLLFVAIARVADSASPCCQSVTAYCNSNANNIYCQNCVDGNCTEKTYIWSPLSHCRCEFDEGLGGCKMVDSVYCVYQFNCIEVPPPCVDSSKKNCDTDWSNPSPFAGMGTAVRRVATGDHCGAY